MNETGPDVSGAAEARLRALLAQYGPDEVMRRARAANEGMTALAREHSGEFVRQMLRDERSGKPVVFAPMHDEWHALVERHARLILWAHVDSGKTQQLSIGHSVWRIGKDPSARIAIVSNTYTQAEKIVRTIGKYIEESPVVHRVFPDLQRSEPWSSSVLTVRRSAPSKDPSIQAMGVHGAVLGSRLDLILLDDILDYENTRTAEQRRELLDWFKATLLGRLAPGGRIIIVGTAWHTEDLLHVLAKSLVWHSVKYPVQRPDGTILWPERWPLERIAATRIEMGSVEAGRQLDCEARADDDRRILRKWFDPCLVAGKGFALLDHLDPADLPAGAGLFTGVDLGVGKHVGKGDLTSLFTLIVYNDQIRQLLGLESGRWPGPEIVRRIISVAQRFGSILYVENNAAQDYILQFAREANAAITCRPFTTGANKANPEFGIESMGAEIEAAKWIIPTSDGTWDGAEPEVRAWMQELVDFDPNDHTGDRLMASWFAREGARRWFATRHGTGGVRVVG
ncbi:hypothetical protein LLH23_17730 [bacterium]|nr:hypothetical protein [bacterium]